MPVSASSILTTVYRAGLANLIVSALVGVDRMWNQLFSFDDPVASLRTIGRGTATWVEAGQRAAADSATRYLEAIYAEAANIDRAQVAPFARALDVVGVAANGRPIAQLTDSAAGVYLRRSGDGWSDEDAAAAAHAWLNRVTGTEPMRAANETVMQAVRNDQRFTGRYLRITRPDACTFCQLIADRGYLLENVGFAAHPQCRCTPGPEIAVRAAPVEQRRAAAAVREPSLRNRGRTVPLENNAWTRTQKRDIRNALTHALDGIRPEIADRLWAVRGPNGADLLRNPTAWGWYQSATRSITLSKPVFDTSADSQAMYRLQFLPAYAGRASWWPQTIDPTKIAMIQNVITHEIGHFLDDCLTADQRYALFDQINRYGWTSEQAPPRDRYKTLAGTVSEYAAEGANVKLDKGKELIAEAWAEYKLADDPRPLARLIGESLLSTLGSST